MEEKETLSLKKEKEESREREERRQRRHREKVGKREGKRRPEIREKENQWTSEIILSDPIEKPSQES